MFEDFDQDRLSALFSSFPAERDPWNTASYDEKMSFWLKAIEQQLLSRGDSILSFNSKDLDQTFATNGAVPLCIDTVLDKLVEEEKVVEFGEFAVQKSIQTRVTSLMLSPLYYAWKTVLPCLPLTKRNCLLVHVPLVERFCQSIETAKDKSLLDYDDFFLLCQKAGLPKSDVPLMIKYLEYRQKITTVKTGTMLVIKFKSAEELTINEADIGTIKLRLTSKLLQEQIDEITTKMNKAKEDAKTALAAGKKSIAMYHLKQKKLLDGILSKRLDSLETIELLVMKIESSKTEIEILDAYKIGSNSLKTILNQKELQIENVEDVMDNLNDVLADHREIEEAMQVVDVLGTDEDFEHELDMLIEEQKDQNDDELIAKLNSLKVADNALPLPISTQPVNETSNERVPVAAS